MPCFMCLTSLAPVAVQQVLDDVAVAAGVCEALIGGPELRAVLRAVVDLAGVLDALLLEACAVLVEKAHERGIFGDLPGILDDDLLDPLDIHGGEGGEVGQKLVRDFSRFGGALDGRDPSVQCRDFLVLLLDVSTGSLEGFLARCELVDEAIVAELGLDALRLGTLEALFHAARKVVFDVLLGVLEASGEGCGEVAVRPEGVHDGPDLVESIPLLLFAGRDILGRDDDVGDGGAAVAVDLAEVFAGLLLIGGRDAVFAGAAVLSGECDLVGVHGGLLSSWPGRSRGSWWCRVPEKQKHDRRIASESSAEGVRSSSIFSVGVV